MLGGLDGCVVWYMTIVWCHVDFRIFILYIYVFLGRTKGRTNGRGKGREKGRKKGRVDWRTVIEGFIIVLHGCILTPILLPPDRIPVGSGFQKIKVSSAMGLRGRWRGALGTFIIWIMTMLGFLDGCVVWRDQTLAVKRFCPVKNDTPRHCQTTLFSELWQWQCWVSLMAV